MEKDIKIYLSVLIISWVIIIAYLINYESQKSNREEMIKKELETYPVNHSQITDSTLKNGK